MKRWCHAILLELPRVEIHRYFNMNLGKPSSLRLGKCKCFYLCCFILRVSTTPVTRYVHINCRCWITDVSRQPLSFLTELQFVHSMYRSPNIVRMIKPRRLRWAGHVAWMEEGRSAFKILTGKPTGKRPLGRPRRRWEDNIRIHLEEICINAGNWVDSAQDRN